MKRILTLKTSVFVALMVTLVFGVSLLVYAYASGRAGCTLKSSTAGCSCHSSSANTAVNALLTGPDTVTVGSTTNYTFTVSRTSGTFNTGGVDIAVSTGTLGIGTSSGIKISSGEVVHSAKFTTTTTKTFTFTAPSTAGTVTMYICGAAGTNPPAWNNGANKTIVVKSLTGIENNSTPASYNLNQNFPNPFNPVTKINYDLAKTSEVSLVVYNLLGKKVSTLVNQKQDAGYYSVDFNAANLSSGVYYYKIQAGDFTSIKRMTLIK
jgi:Secretion system C-terminal sorting domain